MRHKHALLCLFPQSYLAYLKNWSNEPLLGARAIADAFLYCWMVLHAIQHHSNMYASPVVPSPIRTTWQCLTLSPVSTDRSKIGIFPCSPVTLCQTWSSVSLPKCGCGPAVDVSASEQMRISGGSVRAQHHVTLSVGLRGGVKSDGGTVGWSSTRSSC